MCKVQEKKKQEDATNRADQEAKLEIVLSHIREHVSSDSPHPELRSIYSALEAGDRLSGKIISGGWTNYSYKIFLQGNPDCRLFAKVCFSYALWCPGEESTYYDLERQTTEFRLMQHFSNHLDAGVVAKPYLLVDVSNDLRIIVTEWAAAEEQWANQFIDGYVDRRLIAPLAETMAKIHLTTQQDFPKDLNEGMKAGLNTMMEAFDRDIAKYFDDDHGDTQKDACLAHLAHLGKDRVDAIVSAMRLAAFTDQSVLGHADLHVFNILVESKPYPPSGDVLPLDRRFGPKGNFCICDWEMAHWCPKGRDIGLLYSFPIATAYFHAAQGHLDLAQDMIDCLREHWQVYSDTMVANGGGDKPEAYLKEAFRSVLGFCGMFLFIADYILDGFTEHIHKDGLSDVDVIRALGLIGKTGLQFMEWSFMEDVDEADLDLDGLRNLFHAIVEENIMSFALSRSGKRPSRLRSSFLRASGRRVSDASLLSSQSFPSAVDFDEDLM